MASKSKRIEKTASSKSTTGLLKASLAGKTRLALRRKAEKILQEKATLSLKNLEALSLEEIRFAFHDLQVHQIELEMQNEELLRTQTELDLAQARYFDLYDLAPVGYCTLNKEGLIVESNLTAATLLGESRSTLIKRPISRFIFKEDQDSYYLRRKQLFADDTALRQSPGQTNSEQSSEPQSVDLRMVKKDGTVFWAHLKMTTAQKTDDVSMFRLILSDISDRKKAEAERIEFEAQVRQLQKAESLQRMAGAIAHLFNNQLCVVLGNLEMTLNDMVGDALPRQYLVDAMLAARRSSEVSSLLLTYLGQNTGRPEPLDLSAICRNNLPRIEAVAPTDIAITSELLSPGPVVQANANQIQQILTHLITNAWEAIGETVGRISVATKTLSISDIPITHVAPSDWQSSVKTFACLEVTDSGCGMNTEAMDRIFDPFFTTKLTGRGLGLAVITGLVKTWNGMVSVNSAVGKGSTFRVYLPLVTDMVPRKTEVLPGLWDLKVERTVLLVENDSIVRKLIESLLKRLNFTVFTAASGNEAITFLERHQGSIDCLITDLSMPGMDGWETLAALRKIQPGLPAVLSSGYDEAHAMNGNYAEQPQAFLKKPYMIDDLKNALSQVLENASLNTN
jgi:PAS domain S-box-containing protein